MDTAGIAYKNPNVFADLSGLIEGNEAEIERFSREPLFCNNLKRAFIYTDNYEKYLFGTDWPLTGIKVYTEFIRQLIPEEYYEAVFYHNAIKVFPKLRRILENQG
jgi:predicted TIM-barrel fold metal-dependent hydrolase